MVRALLTHEGYAAVNVERVSRESGVAKTAIYRRWDAKAAMVFETVVHGREIAPPADCGTLAGDLAALVEHVVRLLSTPLARAAVPGLLADIGSDDDLRQQFHHTLIEPELRVVEQILARGRERGEVAPDVRAKDVHAQLLGTVFAWVYLVERHTPHDLATRITRALLGAAHVEGACHVDPA